MAFTGWFPHRDNAPVPNDQQVPAVPDSLLRESPRYWYPDPSYDQCCDDTQLHVPYTAYTFLVAGYVGDVRFGGGTGPGWVLAPGASRSSSSLRVVLHDSEDNERQGLGVRETLKASAGAPRHRRDLLTGWFPHRRSRRSSPKRRSILCCPTYLPQVL